MSLTPALNNNIALVKNYLDDPNNLYSVFRDSSLTSDLETPMLEFVGASTISYPVFKLSTAVMPDYNPKNGYTPIDSVLERREVAVTQDKGYQIRIDYVDLEDSHTSAIAYLNNQIRQVEVPTIDKYRLSTMVTKAGTKVVTGAITKANFFAKYDAAIEAYREAELPIEGTVMYMISSVYTALKSSDEVKRIIEMKDKNIDRNVQYIDSVTKIVIIPASRMPANVQFILVNPKAVMCGYKRNKTGLVAEPEDFDGILVNRRVKHDLIVQEDRAKAVYVALTAAEQASSTPSTEQASSTPSTEE